MVGAVTYATLLRKCSMGPDPKMLEVLVDGIVSNVHPLRILLFGRRLGEK